MRLHADVVEEDRRGARPGQVAHGGHLGRVAATHGGVADRESPLRVVDDVGDADVVVRIARPAEHQLLEEHLVTGLTPFDGEGRLVGRARVGLGEVVGAGVAEERAGIADHLLHRRRHGDGVADEVIALAEVDDRLARVHRRLDGRGVVRAAGGAHVLPVGQVVVVIARRLLDRQIERVRRSGHQRDRRAAVAVDVLGEGTGHGHAAIVHRAAVAAGGDVAEKERALGRLVDDGARGRGAAREVAVDQGDERALLVRVERRHAVAALEIANAHHVVGDVHPVAALSVNRDVLEGDAVLRVGDADAGGEAGHLHSGEHGRAGVGVGHVDPHAAAVVVRGDGDVADVVDVVAVKLDTARGRIAAPDVDR